MSHETRDIAGFKAVYGKIRALESAQSLVRASNASSIGGEGFYECLSLYRSLLTDFPEIVVEKSIDTLLWRSCFHTKIEAARKEIKALTLCLEEKYSVRGGGVAKNYSKSEERLVQVCSALQVFLSQALSFYQNLITTFDEKGGNIEYDTSYVKRQQYLCLLYMGDVARYTELHADSSKHKDWTTAVRYYNRARYAMPDSGNPHNQLAVLASYALSRPKAVPIAGSALLSAVHHYCCSILIRLPFKTGVDNLRKVYERNIARFNRLATVSNFLKQDGTLNVLDMTSFISRFLFVHGHLFCLTLGNENSKLCANDMVELVHQHLPPLMKDFGLLLQRKLFKGLELVHMTVVSLFSLHFDGRSISDDCIQAFTFEMKRKECEPLLTQRRTTKDALSLIMFYGLINKVSQAISGDRSGPRPTTRNDSLLQVISIFGDWAQESHGALCLYHSVVNSTSLLDDEIPVIKLSLASPPLIREEIRSRSALRAALTEVLLWYSSLGEGIHTCATPSSTTTIGRKSPLPEHVELRGFIPLSKRYETNFVGEYIIEANDSNIRFRRLSNVSSCVAHCFAQSAPSVICSSSNFTAHGPAIDKAELSPSRKVDRKSYMCECNNMDDNRRAPSSQLLRDASFATVCQEDNGGCVKALSNFLTCEPQAYNSPDGHQPLRVAQSNDAIICEENDGIPNYLEPCTPDVVVQDEPVMLRNFDDEDADEVIVFRPNFSMRVTTESQILSSQAQPQIIFPGLFNSHTNLT